LPDLEVGGLQSANPYLAPLARRNAGGGVSGGRAEKTAKRPFFSFLSHVKHDVVEEGAAADGADGVQEGALAALLDGVHSAGDALKKRPCPDEIERYKKAVRAFMRVVVKGGFSVEESEGILNRYKPQYKDRKAEEGNKRKRFTTVAVIDEKLEALAASIMAGQAEQVRLLARIDEISGLIINLLN
jgi:uncharacterized protein YaaR (DUF327 family)